MMHINAQAIPTNDTNYSCHTKAVGPRFISHHWLFNSLRRGHTHTNTHTHTDIVGKSNLKKPAPPV